MYFGPQEALLCKALSVSEKSYAKQNYYICSYHKLFIASELLSFNRIILAELNKNQFNRIILAELK